MIPNPRPLSQATCVMDVDWHRSIAAVFPVRLRRRSARFDTTPQAPERRVGRAPIGCCENRRSSCWDPRGEAEQKMWRRSFELNLFATVELARRVILVLRARGRGVICDCSSNRGETPADAVCRWGKTPSRPATAGPVRSGRSRDPCCSGRRDPRSLSGNGRGARGARSGPERAPSQTAPDDSWTPTSR